MTKITFNTGRLYQPLGQVITVLALPDQNVTLFKDHSRGIAGEIQGICPTYTPAPYAAWVMGRYDHREYKMSVDALNLDQLDTIHNVRL